MSNDASEKYKLFRNYMANELGVTRADIERWTKESVAVEVNKRLGQLNIHDMVKNTIANAVRDSFRSGYSTSSAIDGIKKELAHQILDKFTLTFKQ